MQRLGRAVDEWVRLRLSRVGLRADARK